MIDQLPVEIIQQQQNQLLIRLPLKQDNGLFDGHFPEFPILAGVLQVHLAIKLYEKYQKQKINFAGFRNLKFFRPIFPGASVNLQCQLDLNKGTFEFQFFKQDKIFSKGVVVIKHA